MKTNIMFGIILLIAAKVSSQQNCGKNKPIQLQRVKFFPNVKMPALKK